MLSTHRSHGGFDLGNSLSLRAYPFNGLCRWQCRNPEYGYTVSINAWCTRGPADIVLTLRLAELDLMVYVITGARDCASIPRDQELHLFKPPYFLVSPHVLTCFWDLPDSGLAVSVLQSGNIGSPFLARQQSLPALSYCQNEARLLHKGPCSQAIWDRGWVQTY